MNYLANEQSIKMLLEIFPTIEKLKCVKYMEYYYWID